MTSHCTVTYWSMTTDGVWIGYWIYWPLTHNPWVQVITVSSLISTLYKSLLQTLTLLQSAVSSLVVSWQRLLIVEIFQLHVLTCLLSGDYPITELSTHSLMYRLILRFKVKVILRLAVYRKLVPLSAKPTGAHEQRFSINCLSTVYFLAYNISARTT
jgi:hypothetical protein